MSDRDDDDDDSIVSPPEGAPCSVHPDRSALVVCPECRRHACLACWHHPLRRCHACLTADPRAGDGPVAWERSASLPARLFGTLASALRPVHSAPIFAHADPRRALAFFALTFVPLASLAVLMPMTRTLLFTRFFSIELVGAPSPAEVALDVVRAMGIGLAGSLAILLAIAMPYVSLARAYAAPGAPRSAPVAVVLYRAFLLPLAMVLQDLAQWNALTPEDGWVTLAALLAAGPVALLFVSLRSSARMASGAGPVGSFLVTVVPFAAMFVAGTYLATALEPLLPQIAPPAAANTAVEAQPR